MELELKMQQKLSLNQEMLQSVEILQMTAQELKEYLEEAAMENPLMDFQEQEFGEQAALKEKLEWLESTDEQNRVYERMEAEASGGEGDIWNLAGREEEESLEEFLKSQLLTQGLREKEERIFCGFIEALDERGYLERPLEDLAGEFSLSEKEAAEYLARLQALEPAGVGARDLSECLALQLRRQSQEETLALCIAERYLELLGKNQLPQIAKKTGASIEEVKRAAEIIRLLEPRPGRLFGREETTAYITPDVTVVKFRGFYEILLNDRYSPQVKINGYYARLLKDTEDQETQSYLLGKYRQAQWIQDCIRRREETILAITKAVIRRQSEFFASGRGLCTLQMREVAEELGIHDSTVSRTVKGKYLQCTWGIYPLRFFFQGAAAKKAEGSFTASQVQEAMKALIAGEDKARPLSDQKIMEYLAGQNLAVSRRTVAKYRKQLGILDASHRRKYEG